MIIRSICGIFIILGSGYVGMFFASRLSEKVRQIESLEKMLILLSFNIEFLALPLHRAMSRTANSSGGVAEKILKIASGIMKSRPDARVKDAWKEAVSRCKMELLLDSEEMEILYAFGENLGSGDRENCLNNINITLAKLKLCRENTAAKLQKDGRMWRGMGFLFGMLIVILLI